MALRRVKPGRGVKIWGQSLPPSPSPPPQPGPLLPSGCSPLPSSAPPHLPHQKSLAASQGLDLPPRALFSWCLLGAGLSAGSVLVLLAGKCPMVLSRYLALAVQAYSHYRSPVVLGPKTKVTAGAGGELQSGTLSSPTSI